MKKKECPLLKPEELVDTGKYWGLRFAQWDRYKVNRVAANGGGTGSMVRGGEKTRYGNMALSNCELFCGPFKSWINNKPNISKKKLIEAGASEFWFR